MKNVKIIFFDIDGTLIDMTRKAISDKTVETLLSIIKVLRVWSTFIFIKIYLYNKEVQDVR